MSAVTKTDSQKTHPSRNGLANPPLAKLTNSRTVSKSEEPSNETLLNRVLGKFSFVKSLSNRVKTLNASVTNLTTEIDEKNESISTHELYIEGKNQAANVLLSYLSETEEERDALQAQLKEAESVIEQLNNTINDLNRQSEPDEIEKNLLRDELERLFRENSQLKEKLNQSTLNHHEELNSIHPNEELARLTYLKSQFSKSILVLKKRLLEERRKVDLLFEENKDLKLKTLNSSIQKTLSSAQEMLLDNLKVAEMDKDKKIASLERQIETIKREARQQNVSSAKTITLADQQINNLLSDNQLLKKTISTKETEIQQLEEAILEFKHLLILAAKESEKNLLIIKEKEITIKNQQQIIDQLENSNPPS